MNDAIKNLLKTLEPINSVQEEDNALKEVIQQIALLGLQRGGFFEKGAFYGGTALRMLYGLDRFSEDLDFCLTKKDPEFTLEPYFSSIKDELARFDFDCSVSGKRTGSEVMVESVFVKQSTYQGLIVIGKNARCAQSEQLIKVKIEVDKSNPPGAEETEMLVQLPVPFLVRTLTLPSLFAGKLHAVIARAYLNRVKGRDYYDLVFYMSRSVPVNLKHLEAKLRDSGNYTAEESLTREVVIELLCNKFESVDFEKAKQDVIPFLKRPEFGSVNNWSKELFSALVQNLRAQ